jgi:hypothetical protein
MHHTAELEVGCRPKWNAHLCGATQIMRLRRARLNVFRVLVKEDCDEQHRH